MRRRPLTLLIAGMFTFSGQHVLAQDEDTEETTELERVEVTGSRIRQAQVEGVRPVQTLTREDLERTGYASVGEILQRITASGGAINTRFNSSGNFGFPPDGSGVGAGSTNLDLRFLGPKRVLVLVDGVRWVPGAAASGVPVGVDLNTIPLAMIERVEILKDGASSIYGSDAIAGVVNFITRKEVSGVEATGYYGVYDDGEGPVKRATLSAGTQGERSSMSMMVDFFDQDSILASERDLADVPVPFTGLTRGSSGTPQGRFVFIDPNTGQLVNHTPVPGSPAVPDYDPANPNTGGDYQPFTNDTRFNFSPFNMYQTPSERLGVFAQGTWEIADDVEFFLKGMFNRRESKNQAAPEPIFIGPLAGIGGLADVIVVDADNPFNPYGVDLFADGFGFLGRRPLEHGPRLFRQQVDTFYVSTGFEGGFNVGERYWIWNAQYAYGLNSAKQQKEGALNLRRIANALGDPAECAQILGCVPLNIFGGQGPDGQGTITQEMLDYIGFIQKDESENSITDITINITGDLFDLPAGPLAFAAGYEYRDQDGFFLPDPVVVAGDSNGIPAQPTSGGYDVDEFYVEFAIPILADQPGAEFLDATASIRFSDFSTFGSTETGKVGLRWGINEQVLLRGTFAEGFRAPGIGELFGSQTRFDAVLSDPCGNFDAISQQEINNCIAQGVPADGSFEQANPQISVLTGGNPNLQPEESDTITAGIVYSPAWATDLAWSQALDFELTYYDIELEGAIQAPDAQTILNQCVATNDPSVCSAISRGSTGAINRFENTLTNIGRIETSGWDFNVNWTSPAYDWGQLSAVWTNSFVDEFVEFNPTDTGLQATDLAGIERNDRGFPEWQSNFRLDWLVDAWRVTGTIRHIDELTESCSDFLDGTPDSLTQLGLCSNPNFEDESLSTNELDATTYFDLQVAWSGLPNTVLEVGAHNLFDEDPPPCLSCSLNGYDPSTHDPAGQFIYVRGTYTF